jgi:hypothetical protein
MASRRSADWGVVGAGIVLVGLGVFFTLVLFDVLDFSTLRYVAPILLILLGLFVVMRGFNAGGWAKGDDSSAATFEGYRPRSPEGGPEG